MAFDNLENFGTFFIFVEKIKKVILKHTKTTTLTRAQIVIMLQHKIIK